MHAYFNENLSNEDTISVAFKIDVKNRNKTKHRNFEVATVFVLKSCPMLKPL